MRGCHGSTLPVVTSWQTVQRKRSLWLSQYMAFKSPQGDSGLPALTLGLPTVKALLIESHFLTHPPSSTCRLSDQRQSLDHLFKSAETQCSFHDEKILLDFMLFFASLDRQVKSYHIQKAAVVSQQPRSHSSQPWSIPTNCHNEHHSI